MCYISGFKLRQIRKYNQKTKTQTGEEPITIQELNTAIKSLQRRKATVWSAHSFKGLKVRVLFDKSTRTFDKCSCTFTKAHALLQ